MNISLKAVLLMINWDIDLFLDSTEVLPILQVRKWGFQLWSLSIFHKFRSKLPICNDHSVYFFFCGQDNLLGGQFWAMGMLNLLGGQSNLLGEQMPTQLTPVI